MKRHFFLAIVCLVLSPSISASAKSPLDPINRSARWFGYGHSDGYHKCDSRPYLLWQDLPLAEPSLDIATRWQNHRSEICRGPGCGEIIDCQSPMQAFRGPGSYCDQGSCDQPGCDQPGCDQIGCDQIGCDQIGCDQIGLEQTGCDQIHCDGVTYEQFDMSQLTPPIQFADRQFEADENFAAPHHSVASKRPSDMNARQVRRLPAN